MAQANQHTPTEDDMDREYKKQVRAAIEAILKERTSQKKREQMLAKMVSLAWEHGYSMATFDITGGKI